MQKVFKKYNIFIENVNKIALHSYCDKRKHSIDSIKIHAYRMKKDLVCNKEEIKCNNIIKITKND